MGLGEFVEAGELGVELEVFLGELGVGWRDLGGLELWGWVDGWAWLGGLLSLLAQSLTLVVEVVDRIIEIGDIDLILLLPLEYALQLINLTLIRLKNPINLPQTPLINRPNPLIILPVQIRPQFQHKFLLLMNAPNKLLINLPQIFNLILIFFLLFTLVEELSF